MNPAAVLHIQSLDEGQLYCFFKNIHHLELRPANELTNSAAHVFIRFDNGDSVNLPAAVWDEIIAGMDAWRKQPTKP